ncbi:MAG: universal stress protein [Deltaproteobacteria bacterium]|nr:universal stress protein [Deltaproteobacteria bacterium]
MLPKNILVPTDLSEGAEHALDYACELAQKLGATVHFLNVISVPAMGVPELGVALTGSVMDAVVKDNQVALDKLAATRRGLVTLGQTLLRVGDARDVINETAIELNIDLIVMGTHGRRGVSRFLMGSVAETVVRSAPCPVLTVRTREKTKTERDAA